jgi:hypothetical protein
VIARDGMAFPRLELFATALAAAAGGLHKTLLLVLTASKPNFSFHSTRRKGVRKGVQFAPRPAMHGDLDHDALKTGSGNRDGVDW